MVNIGSVQQTTLLANAPDAYSRFLDVLDNGLYPVGTRIEVVEGIFNIQVAGVELLLKETGSPPAVADKGTSYPAGSYEGWGPAITAGTGLRLDMLWIREVVAGAGGVVTFRGVVRLLDG